MDIFQAQLSNSLNHYCQILHLAPLLCFSVVCFILHMVHLFRKEFDSGFIFHWLTHATVSLSPDLKQ